MDNYVFKAVQRDKHIVDLIFKLTGGQGFIAGGFARYCLSNNNEPIIPNDIDIFCGDIATFESVSTLFKRHPDIVRKSDSEIETKYEYRVAFGYHKDAYSIQLIKPAEIKNMVSDGDFVRVLDNFDFTIAKCAVLPDGRGIAHKDFDLHDSESKLVITNIHCPISSAKRVIKYCGKGFTVESKELLKLFRDYENRPQEWKDIVIAGLSGDDLSDLTDEERKRFVRTMYFD